MAGAGSPLPGEQATAPLPQRLLVPFDGSDPALRAAVMACRLARAGGGTVRLLSAIEPQGLRGLGAVLPSGTIGEAIRGIEQALRAAAETDLQRVRDVCAAAGVPCTSAVVFDIPVRAIVAAAADADLIVMGSRGHGAVAGAVLGSVAHRILGATDRPVLVVH
ncbi:MAG: universal stress protein [bacterium]|nr:universal stress protein [bacterium]